MFFINSLEDYNYAKDNFNCLTKIKFKCQKCNNIFEKLLRACKFYPILCKRCLTVKTNLERYNVSCPFNRKDIRLKTINSIKNNKNVVEKRKNTCLKKYGVNNPHKDKNIIEKTKQTCLNKYNVDNPMKLKENKEKIKNTCLKRYGVSSFSQTKSFIKSHKKRYTFEGISFDSKWELYFWIYCKDHNLNIQKNIDSFSYYFDNKEHLYYPDFKIDNKYIEIKGLQFFENKDITKKMINPYGHTQNELYEAKHQCMIKNNVIIITNISKYKKYVLNKFNNE